MMTENRFLECGAFMEYSFEWNLRDGRRCVLRNAEETDAESFLTYFVKAHGETDFLLTYPDESVQNVDDIRERLKSQKNSANNVEICAFVDGVLAGSAGFDIIGGKDKLRHRADFGISILREFWGLGIGSALTEACIECAEKAGYLQLELEVVADNTRAIELYKKYGFVVFGRNPLGFRTREGKWQELVLMRLELGRK